MKNPIKMDDLGVPLFLETPMSVYQRVCYLFPGQRLFFHGVLRYGTWPMCLGPLPYSEYQAMASEKCTNAGGVGSIIIYITLYNTCYIKWYRYIEDGLRFWDILSTHLQDLKKRWFRKKNDIATIDVCGRNQASLNLTCFLDLNFKFNMKNIQYQTFIKILGCFVFLFLPTRLRWWSGRLPYFLVFHHLVGQTRIAFANPSPMLNWLALTEQHQLGSTFGVWIGCPEVVKSRWVLNQK